MFILHVYAWYLILVYNYIVHIQFCLLQLNTFMHAILTLISFHNNFFKVTLSSFFFFVVLETSNIIYC